MYQEAGLNYQVKTPELPTQVPGFTLCIPTPLQFVGEGLEIQATGPFLPKKIIQKLSKITQKYLK